MTISPQNLGTEMFWYQNTTQIQIHIHYQHLSSKSLHTTLEFIGVLQCCHVGTIWLNR